MSKSVRDTQPSSQLVTVADVAAELRVTQRFVRHLIASGDLRAVKIGSRIVRIRHEDVEALLRPMGGAA